MRRLRLGDKILRVRDEPEPPPSPGRSGPPLLCIHGAGMSSVSFLDVVRRLSVHRRVIAPDLPGHGQSDPWHDEIHLDGYRDAVGTVCARLGVQRAVLLGHSMGAAVALRCALTWPERVAGLVLVNGAARLRVDREVLALLDAALPQDPGPEDVDPSAPSADEQPVGRMPDAMAQLSFSPHTLPDLRARWQAVLYAAPRRVILGDLRACDGFDVRAALPGLRVPTLVVAGEDDLVVPAKLAKEAAALISGARLCVLPRSGHFSHLEQADAFHDEVLSFLRTS